MKLNSLLAVTDSLRAAYKSMIADYTKYFNKSQGAFLGCQNTYQPREGAIDEPSKRKLIKVVTTVEEKFDYLQKNSKEFINALFSQEKTNGSGAAKATLTVDGEEWGEFTSLELLRLKSLLESNDLGDINGMLSVIPVRSDAEIWEKSNNELYEGREIYETPKLEGISKTTEKKEYILEDPNLKPGMDYRPQKAMKTVPMEIGDYTTQNFSGEWSQRKRAAALKNRQVLLTATIKALKECNDCEAVDSQLTADRIFGFIFK